ncbi:LacI family DNA-binding transcriptional regulator [Pseudopedobacter beijingensis]|uniref:LacI family DNA-binding transcriptional regulator n=1 Tax=Pseudopedobacter beijingensis TaxID=1207056 RepID=A0ABW4IEY9_9SPHI
MGKRISINSIAKDLGISITTVSFVLNGKAQEKRISDKLVKKVMEYVEKSGYKPNSLARSLRTGKSNIIGLIVEDISYPFFSTIAKEIEEKAYKNGYKIIYSSTENNIDKTKELIEMYKDKHVDGYIIVPPEGIEDEINALYASGKPVVVLDRTLKDVEVDNVVVNNYDSVYKATKYLISNGFKNIAFVTLNSLQSQMLDRLSGYEQAIVEQGLMPYIKEVSYIDSEQAKKHILSFIERKVDVLDAIVFATNYLCVSGLKALKELRLHIPDKMAVVSFDDYELFEMYSPSITSIAQPTGAIAENAINLLLSRLKKQGQDKRNQKVVLPTTLIIRESSEK